MTRLEKRLEEVENQMADLRCENEKKNLAIEQLLRRIETLMRGIKILIEQLETNHIQPNWRPDEWSPEDIKG